MDMLIHFDRDGNMIFNGADELKSAKYLIAEIDDGYLYLKGYQKGLISQVMLPYQTAEEVKKHILKVDLQYGNPCVWYQADNSEQDMKKYAFIAIGTGHHIRSDKLTTDNYIGTLLLCGGELVLHYFVVEG